MSGDAGGDKTEKPTLKRLWERDRPTIVSKITSLMPTKDDWKRIVGPILRGTAIGSALGILPGGGAILAAFASYTVEKRISDTITSAP